MRKIVKRLYHGTPGHNFDSIIATGSIEPSWDGFVHLTTSKLAALWYAGRYGTGAAVFIIAMHALDASRLEKYLGGIAANDECYRYKGELAMKLDSVYDRIMQDPVLSALDANGRNGEGLTESAKRYQEFLKTEGE